MAYSRQWQQWLERAKERNDCLWSGKSPFCTLPFSFQINISVKISVGLLRNLCGNFHEKFVSDEWPVFSAKIRIYKQNKHTNIHNVELKTDYFSFDWLLQNRFLCSISSKRLTVEVSALGELNVLFHAPLVSSLCDSTSQHFHRNWLSSTVKIPWETSVLSLWKQLIT